MPQIYATIRKQSKYYHSQQRFEKGKPLAFPVRLDFTDPMWPVKGGVGGNYTLFDVDLWAVSGDSSRMNKIPMHSKP